MTAFYLDEQFNRWYHRGAEKGFAPGQVNLGALYVEGQGVEKIDAEA